MHLAFTFCCAFQLPQNIMSLNFSGGRWRALVRGAAPDPRLPKDGGWEPEDCPAHQCCQGSAGQAEPLRFFRSWSLTFCCISSFVIASGPPWFKVSACLLTCAVVSVRMCHVSIWIFSQDIVIAHPMNVQRDLNNQIQECQKNAQMTHLITTHCFYQLLYMNHLRSFWIWINFGW